MLLGVVFAVVAQLASRALSEGAIFLRRALEFEEEKHPRDSHGKFTDVSLWVLVGFGLLLIWFAHGVVTEANVQRLFIASLVYMVVEGAKTITKMIVNGMTRRVTVKQFMRDGKLDGIEAAALSATDTAALIKRPSSSP